MLKVTNDFDFAKYDIGGNGATAGDGKLTGEEVAKANRAGYSVWDGYKAEDGQPAPGNGKGYAFGFFTRDSALSDSEFCKKGSVVLDVLLAGVTIPASIIKATLEGLQGK